MSDIETAQLLVTTLVLSKMTAFSQQLVIRSSPSADPGVHISVGKDMAGLSVSVHLKVSGGQVKVLREGD